MGQNESNRNADEGPYLRITDVTKNFGNFTALRDISLDIFEGEFVCFLGPSGCGKTTLLRAIAGLDIQTSGRVEQAGEDISALPPTMRDFGIVFQSYALFPNLSVIANVGYGLANRGASKDELSTRVNELLDLVGLPDQGDKYPAQLSGGQQQRVALARALATSPGLLLLDEPLSALDAKVRTHLRSEMKDLQRRLGVTTIMVTHDQEEALTMADRIVVMNNGFIEQVGTPEEIYRHPASPFVADFVGSMNFLTATPVKGGGVKLGNVTFVVEQDRADLFDGSQVTVCIRPEDVMIRNVEERTTNSFEATVLDLEFLGSFVRARMCVKGVEDTEFTADFSINLMRDKNIETGRNLRVAWPEKRIHLFGQD